MDEKKSIDGRFDVRSKEQFTLDIKRASQIEAFIAVRLAIKEHAVSGIWSEITANGCDASGNYIPNRSKVTTEPDFKIGDKFVEITNSRRVCPRVFHEKVHKVDKIIQNNYDLVFVNGFEEQKQPKFIRLSGEDLKPFIDRSITKYGKTPTPIGRNQWRALPSLRFDVYWFKDLFQILPVLSVDLLKVVPQQYKDILALTG